MKTSSQFVAAIAGCLALITCGASRADEEDPGGWERVPSATGRAESSGSSADAPSSSSPPWAVGHPQRGPDDAPVIIVEFADFQCPFCRKAQPTVTQILETYGDQVRLIHMDFPLSQHPAAQGAAIAARCADEQGQFWPYHDALYANQADLSHARFKSIARTLGLAAATFDACLDSQRYASEIAADQSVGRQIGVSSTPSFVINHKALAGAASFAQFRALIDQELAQSRR